MPQFPLSTSLSQDSDGELFARVPRLHVVRSEDRPSYDGNAPAPAREWRPMMPPELFGGEYHAEDIAVYGSLCCFVDGKTGNCWPSHDAIGKRVRLSRNTVAKAIGRLEKGGLVQITNQDTRGMKRSNLYHLPHQTTANVQMHTKCATLHTTSAADAHGVGSRCAGDVHEPYVSEPNDKEPNGDLLSETSSDVGERPAEASQPQKPTKATTYPDAMLTFWDAYPAIGRERSSRKQVLAEWVKIKPDPVTLDAILDGLTAWKAKAEWCSRFAPGAHLFLARAKWQELPLASEPQPTNGHHLSAFDRTTANFDRVMAQLFPDDADVDVIETNGVVLS